MVAPKKVEVHSWVLALVGVVGLVLGSFVQPYLNSNAAKFERLWGAVSSEAQARGAADDNLRAQLAAQSERLARIETKIDLLVSRHK